MAVTSMRLVTVTGSLRRLDGVLENCAQGGDFQFEQAMSFFGAKSDFAPLNDENPYSSPCNRLKTALTQARLQVCPEETVSALDISWDDVEGLIADFTASLEKLSSKRSTLEEERERLKNELSQLRHFDQLDIRLGDMYDCKYIKLRFGRLPKESFDRLKYYDNDPYIVLVPCSSDDKWVWGVYFAPLTHAADVDRVFQSLMWERLHLPLARATAAEECTAMEQKLSELDDRISEADEALKDLWSEKQSLYSALLHTLERRSAAFDLRRYVARHKSGDRFFLAGWVTEQNADSLAERIRSVGHVECEIERPDTVEGHEPPVRLKNNRLARPFEFYVSMYGLPSYNEIDPTLFVAITYSLLFGMMFADVGQGLVLSLFGWFIMWKKMKNPLGKILAPCGIASAFFGTLLGSVFGFEHWLDDFWTWVNARTGIPINHGKLINIEDTAVINVLIYATIGIGAVMVICAMLLSIITSLRQKQLGTAIFSSNGIAGLCFYVSVVYAAVQMLVFGNSNILSAPYILCLIVLPLLLIFLQEPLGELIEGKEHWLPENLGDFAMQNFFELFEVILSYVSNTVSFLRVGAFVLVHYGMMTVVFTLAEMSAEGSPAYILVVILGNLLVIVLEGLLVGIQSLRLEFYEMFSRFYTGSGKPFTPIETRLPVHQG